MSGLSKIEVGGWPDLRSEAPAVDSNGDGIPDWWCVKHGFDPTSEFDLHGDCDFLPLAALGVFSLCQACSIEWWVGI